MFTVSPYRLRVSVFKSFKKFKKACEKLGYDSISEQDKVHGVTMVAKQQGELVLYIQCKGMDKKTLLLTIVHEAVHIVDWAFDGVGEPEEGIRTSEFHAYLVENTVRCIMDELNISP